MKKLVVVAMVLAVLVVLVGCGRQERGISLADINGLVSGFSSLNNEQQVEKMTGLLQQKTGKGDLAFYYLLDQVDDSQLPLLAKDFGQYATGQTLINYSQFLVMLARPLAQEIGADIDKMTADQKNKLKEFSQKMEYRMRRLQDNFHLQISQIAERDHELLISDLKKTFKKEQYSPIEMLGPILTVITLKESGIE